MTTVNLFRILVSVLRRLFSPNLPSTCFSQAEKRQVHP